MPMSAEEIESRIKVALPNAQIDLVDLAGDNDHWEVTVMDASFKDMSRVAQHKCVQAAFGADLGTTLHALAIKTRAA